MFRLVLMVHSILRWGIVGLGVVACSRAAAAWSMRRPWTSIDRAIVLALLAAMDLQVLVGIVLYIKSPITMLGIHEVALTTSYGPLLFWTFVHPVLMIAALIVVHVANRAVKRATDDALRHRSVALHVGLALLLILLAIPWPFLRYGRALL